MVSANDPLLVIVPVLFTPAKVPVFPCAIVTLPAVALLLLNVPAVPVPWVKLPFISQVPAPLLLMMAPFCMATAEGAPVVP